MTAELLEVSALRAGYGAVEVLRGVDVSIARGEIVALLGANGVGKTTFNAVLSGLLRPWSGTVVFAGAPLAPADSVAALAAGLVQVPEGRHIFPNLSVRENLLLGSYRRGPINRANHAAAGALRSDKRDVGLLQLSGTVRQGHAPALPFSAEIASTTVVSARGT